MANFLEHCTSEGADALIMHTSSFTSGELGQQAAWHARAHSMPVLVWGVPEPAGGALTVNNLCCANFMTSIMHSMGVPYKWVFAAPGDAAAEHGIGGTMRCIRAIAALRNATIAVVGAGRVPGFFGSNGDETAIKARYGVNVRLLALTDLYAKYKAVKPKQAADEISQIKKISKCAADAADVERSARMTLALKAIADEHNAAALAVRCWPEIRDDLQVETCLPMALLADGGVLCSCEADVPGALSMMLQYELTARKAGPPTLLDMVSINEKADFVGLWHCGVSAPSLAQPGTACACLHSIVAEGSPDAPKGLVLESAGRPGPATLLRLQDPGAGRYLAVSGDVLKRKPEFHGSYAAFRPAGMSAADLLNTILTQGVTHHYALAYTDHLDLIREAAYWLDIEAIPVNPDAGPVSHFGIV
jgi:L-fucose isomerase-like protein